MNTQFLVGVLSLGVTAGALAQGQPSPADSLVSPLIVDGAVTLQIHAPNAERVTVIGDWMATRDALELSANADGIWAITINDLRPDYYSYTFNVDGVPTLDPRNPEIKQGIRRVDNMFYLRGAETAFQDNQPVPHGQIRKVWYESDTLGMQRRMHVYTPPDYDDTDRSYPVFYLLHGGGDEDSGWSTIGRAGFILDNLIAAGDARPMIVVMPNGSLPEANRADFERELMNDILRVVEERFRVEIGAKSRAVAGLSMGGSHTTQVIGRNPDEFAYVSIWSSGFSSAEEYESAYADFFAQAEQVNEDVEHFSIIVGTDDFAYPGSVTLSETLAKHGIEHEFIETGGGHTWLNWRQYLHNFARELFQ